MRRHGWPSLFLGFLLAGACSVTHPAHPPVPTGLARDQPARVYTAIGGTETRGEGLDNALQQAWPQDLFRRLPANYTLVNLAIPGVTLDQALADELPLAEALHPNLVTVWRNFADTFNGTSPEHYRAELAVLIRRVRATGATVLVANTPQLDLLPAYLSCQDPVAHPGPCSPFLRQPLPPPEAVRATVAAFNSAIAQIAQAAGARVVDLHAAVLSAHAQRSTASRLSDNGFDLNAAGQQFVADQFAAALGATPIGSVAPGLPAKRTGQ